MTATIVVLLGGLAVLLAGVGLLGTLLGMRAALDQFASLEIGLIMAGYYVGYIAGTLWVPRIIRNVGHIRTFAALAAITAVIAVSFGLLVNPLAWFLLRVINGVSVVGIYMVVESWLNEQSEGGARGRIFSVYMMSTLVALGGGQFLLLAGDTGQLVLFALAGMLITLGIVPVAITRVTEPRIELVQRVHLKDLFRISPLGAVGALAAGIVNGSFWGMTAVFGQRLALDELQIAVLMSATILGGALLQWPIGHFSDRHDRRGVLIVVSLLTATVAGVLAFVVTAGYTGLIVAASIYGGLMFSLYGLCVAHTNDHLQAGQVLEATRGLLLVYGAGALSGPLLVGGTMEYMGAVGLPVVSATTAALLALFGLYRVTRRSPPPLAEQGEYVPMVRTTPVALELYPDADKPTDDTQ
ncbi:MFS transporter [Thiosocius teredinicola]|uniref:MFS transporter n=1 Tax=Thiosocius teredinicola TaxID=1973002 RepID=UPI000991473B